MAMLPGFQRAREKLRDNHPVIAAAADAVRAVAADPSNTTTEQDAERVVSTVIDTIAARPEARAEASAERWWENRYIVSGITMAIGWVLNLLNVDLVVTNEIVVEWGPVIQGVAGWVFARAAAVSLPPFDWRHPIRSILGLRRKPLEPIGR